MRQVHITSRHLWLLSLGVFLFCVTLAHSPLTARAQSFSSLENDRLGAKLELSPAYPRPGDRVTADLKQYLFDPDFALITWKLNGEVVLQGYNEEKYSFVVGPVGSLVALEATIKDREGRTSTAKTTFRISDVAFMWEARTYTPPFFQGRSKFSHGASAVIVAMPTVYSMEGRLYDETELMYTWSIGRNEQLSGIGKNTFVTGPKTPFDNLNVSVQIKDPTGKERMTHYIDVAPTPAKILLYRDDPLLGILYRSALPDSFNLQGEELKLVAEPFYNTTQNRVDPVLSYSWRVNNDTYQFPGSIVLRPDGGRSGVTDVSLIVLNSNNYLERLQKTTSVRYGAPGDQGSEWPDLETNPL